MLEMKKINRQNGGRQMGQELKSKKVIIQILKLLIGRFLLFVDLMMQKELSGILKMREVHSRILSFS